ncbi:MAG: 3-deoxy-7-phosphoheptulonate synthase [Verrucomicrobiales bacterium]|nr:3-deoxy-7-phosphoheptulonate synthase [Verrucomicrobiae bacterium]MCP5556088.1 3-deoxy-7-phosphoheptulonate synthase [Akkermansiaceae bacterium]
MSIRTDDLRITSIHQLIAPVILIESLPVSDGAADVVANARRDAEAILHGQDDRLLVVVGPCSIHDPAAALEYGAKLKAEADRLREDLHIIMRVYFEKPRTTVGWKGLINDPGMNETYDINQGLRIARKLLLDLANLGIPAGTEFLDTISPQYVTDLVSWGAIGARTTESQIHRELASGLSVPVGFKNGTGGSIQIAIDAIKAARQPHHFLSVTKSGDTAIVATKGNDCCHLILRGSTQGPNFSPDDISAVKSRLLSSGLEPYLMVDCSHGNSQKDHRNQPLVAKALGQQVAGGETAICSVMIESHLQEGNQALKDPASLEYGKSITDACVDWNTTVDMLDDLAKSVRARRKTYLA